MSHHDALREAVMHVVLVPPLQHIDDLIDVDLVARMDLALVNLI